MKKLIILLFILKCISAQCQQNLVLYNMPAIQQSMYANPGQMPQCRVNVGLPAISSIYFNLGNNGFKITDVVKKRADDSLYLDIDNFINKLRKNNLLTQSFQIDILSFGFRVKQNYFSVSAIEKENFNFRYPKDLFNWAWNGNGAFLGEEMKFNFGLDAVHYRELGLGYARSFTDKISAGVKLKVLTGLQNASIAKSDITFKTGDPYFDYTAKANIEINTSINDSTATARNYFFNKQNKGLAIDLGAVYKFNDRFTFSGSIIDFGSIKWKSNVTNYVSANPDAEFKFDGVDITPFIDSTGTFNSDSAFNHYLDSIETIFKIDTLHRNYKTKLPTKIYGGVNFKIDDRQNAGLVLYGQFFDKAFYPGMALSYNLKLNKWLSASASYAIVNRSYNNIGFGFALTGPVQLYAVTDNIIGFFLPQSSKTINFRTGLNLCFGRGEKSKTKNSVPTSKRKTYSTKKDIDQDGIPNKTDKCPNEKGTIEFNGCPDRDNDKITDKLDSCPDIVGLAEFNGCPDVDGDKIIDKKDSCPDAAGLADLNGCPDADGDKIIDKLDSCPDVAGVAALLGCPDADGDGVSDSKDKCPNEKGSLAAHGCPDKDADGIIDSEDRCPEIAGIIEKEGCPPAKLYLLDRQGNIIATAVMDKDGKFNFTNLDMDENTLFKLESYDVLISNEFVISNGKSVYVVRKGADGYFHYENIDADANKMGLMNEADIPIQLNKKDAEKVKHAMDELVFDSGKDIIRISSIEGLDILADLLKQNPTWKLKLSGHTDNTSSLKFNMSLSKKRVEAVRNYLVKKGIETQRVVLKWYGPTKPIAPNTTEEGKQQNRRVEFMIIR